MGWTKHGVDGGHLRGVHRARARCTPRTVHILLRQQKFLMVSTVDHAAKTLGGHYNIISSTKYEEVNQIRSWLRK